MMYLREYNLPHFGWILSISLPYKSIIIILLYITTLKWVTLIVDTSYLNLEELSTNHPTKFPRQRAGRHLVNVRSACQCHTCTWIATCSLVSFSTFISSRILLVQLLQQQQNKGQNKNELLQYIKSKSEGWQFLLSIPSWLKATINFLCSSTDQTTLGFLAAKGSSPS